MSDICSEARIIQTNLNCVQYILFQNHFNKLSMKKKMAQTEVSTLKKNGVKI